MKQKESDNKVLRIVARVNSQTKERVARACEHIGIDESNLVRACVEALLSHIENEGRITLPMKVFLLAPDEEVVETSRVNNSNPINSNATDAQPLSKKEASAEQLGNDLSDVPKPDAPEKQQIRRRSSR